MLIVSLCSLYFPVLPFAKISFSISLYLIVYFRKSLPKILTIYTTKERIFDFNFCPSVLMNECLKTRSHVFANLLKVMMKFASCVILGIWYVGNVGC